MKKTFFVLILIALAISGYFWYQKESNKLGEIVVENQKISLGSEESKYSIEGNYPVIKMGIPKNSLKIINEAIYNSIDSETKIVSKEFADLVLKLKDMPTYASLAYLSEYKIDYDFAFSPFINFKFENYSYSGGAHGGTQVNTFVFNAKTGERLQLNSVFIGDYLKKISELALKEIKKEDPELETFIFAEEGLKPDPINFTAWEILPTGIRFVFGDYQIGPYASGRPEITISWQDLDGILNPAFKLNLKFANN